MIAALMLGLAEIEWEYRRDRQAAGIAEWLRSEWPRIKRLCNYAPHNASELDGRVIAELSAIRDGQELLRGFFHASELPLPRTLLS